MFSPSVLRPIVREDCPYRRTVTSHDTPQIAAGHATNPTPPYTLSPNSAIISPLPHCHTQMPSPNPTCNHRSFTLSCHCSGGHLPHRLIATTPRFAPPTDRKSTGLNSSHVEISYAVFCL